MKKALREKFYEWKHRTEFLNYGEKIILSWATDYSRARTDLRVLDIGMSEGRDLLNIKRSLPGKNVELFGVDSRLVSVSEARNRGIAASSIDIEKDPLPFPDQSFDIIMANMIIEHTKELFWIFSEISRTLKQTGIAIIGVPNLASLHSRLALLFGIQPTCIKVYGSHVRGFTKSGFIHFFRQGGFFQVLDVKGSNFYPFPPPVSSILARCFPKMAVSLFFLIKRTGKSGRFISVLDDVDFGTPYFTGDWKRAKSRWLSDCNPT